MSINNNQEDMNNNIYDHLDDFKYDEIETNDLLDEDYDDNIADVLASIQLKQISVYSDNDQAQSDIEVSLKSFLKQLGLIDTLSTFTTEIKKLKDNNKINDNDIINASTIFQPNLSDIDKAKDNQLYILSEQINKMKRLTEKARKERDQSRLYYKSILQEKTNLINDIRRLRNNIILYEPMIEEYKSRYTAVSKEKSLIRLDRDKLRNRIKVIEEQLTILQQIQNNTNATNNNDLTNKTRSATRKVKSQASFPTDGAIPNPYTTLTLDPAPITTYKNQIHLKAHDSSISCVAFHPRKPVFATASDDETWRLWTTSGELVMAGEGHQSWISDLDFHPHGSHLVTSSGDNSVKLWELSQAKCSHTFTEHTQAVCISIHL